MSLKYKNNTQKEIIRKKTSVTNMIFSEMCENYFKIHPEYWKTSWKIWEKNQSVIFKYSNNLNILLYNFTIDQNNKIGSLNKLHKTIL